ncbi:hypothetical protein HK097_007157 [Rhizophlyctis rosea]|uniref:Uncharacterized protein n=1 Tax=Rhizophlyctis rosea TaxID=64517 RepID=A0AAD5SDJ6_9FUNG|nr:hypothetical protein HK097_007157 [Rhizophlyctis rosea]
MLEYKTAANLNKTFVFGVCEVSGEFGPVLGKLGKVVGKDGVLGWVLELLALKESAKVKLHSKLPKVLHVVDLFF